MIVKAQLYLRSLRRMEPSNLSNHSCGYRGRSTNKLGLLKCNIHVSSGGCWSSYYCNLIILYATDPKRKHLHFLSGLKALELQACAQKKSGNSRLKFWSVTGRWFREVIQYSYLRHLIAPTFIFFFYTPTMDTL